MLDGGCAETLVGRYELLDVLGRGGMGVVYRASDRVLVRQVAVKVLPAERAEDPGFVARFEREARAAAALNHPNVVGVFDFGREGRTRFIVMECVAGRNLAQIVRDQGGVDPARAVTVATEIARALAAAHEAGIIHRDIKPANVILQDGGVAKVLDFGIARAAASTSLTQTAVVLGSAPYMAPEVARGERADERSDIYSLGCVLYELLTGRPPFTGELAAAVLHQHNAARPRRPRELNPEVPDGLDALVLRMLAKRPNERPQTAGQLAAELEASQDRRVTAPTARLPASRADVGTSTRPGRWPAGVGRPRHARPIVAAGLVVLLLAAILLAMIGSSGPHPRGSAAGARPATNATGRRPASTRGQQATSTLRRTSTSSSTTTGVSSTAAVPPSPVTVSTAAGALTTLLTQDLQSGAIDQHGHDLLNHLQGIVGSYEQAHGSDALNKLDDLTKHVTDLSDHGDIQPSALAAITAAIDNLRAAIQRAGPVTTAPPGAAKPKAPPHKH